MIKLFAQQPTGTKKQALKNLSFYTFSHLKCRLAITKKGLALKPVKSLWMAQL
jgi:hypothetical protein